MLPGKRTWENQEIEQMVLQKSKWNYEKHQKHQKPASDWKELKRFVNLEAIFISLKSQYIKSNHKQLSKVLL